MKNVVLLSQRGSACEEKLVASLESALIEAGYSVHVDRHLRISLDWARSVDERIRAADAAIAVLSESSMESEMLAYELDVASDARLRNRSMLFIAVPTDAQATAAAALLGGFQTRTWTGQDSNACLIAEILGHLKSPPGNAAGTPATSSGGGVTPESPFYIQRQADFELEEHLNAFEATILIKGARQTGKTSLIAQGIRLLREAGAITLITDFQRLGSDLFGDENAFCRAIATNLDRQVSASVGLQPQWEWDDSYGATSNLDEFLRALLSTTDRQIVWFMDEADRLFATSFADTFFALVRSWHNARAFSPKLSWNRFSVVIAYATEAHLFIQDINQSPFNVGQRIETKDFTLRQTEELNGRYGEPLRGIDQVLELQQLFGGQPFLTRTAFDILVRTSGSLRGLLAAADRDDGPFADHLRRILVSVTQLSDVRHVIERALKNEYIEASPEIYRLVSAGILATNASGNHVIRCSLYRRYLERHLK